MIRAAIEASLVSQTAEQVSRMPPPASVCDFVCLSGFVLGVEFNRFESCLQDDSAFGDF
jgi:hypothetical protein